MANNASAFATKVAFVRLSTKSPFVPQTLPRTFAAFTTERTARRVTLWDNLKWKEAQVVELETGGPLKTGEGLPLWSSLGITSLRRMWSFRVTLFLYVVYGVYWQPDTQSEWEECNFSATTT